GPWIRQTFVGILSDRRRSGRSVFRECVVRIAIQPALPGFARRDHRMLAGAGVLAGVLIRGAVAAERHSAFLAGAEVYPARADLDALFAGPVLRMLDRRDRRDVVAGTHGTLLSQDHRAGIAGGARGKCGHEAG